MIKRLPLLLVLALTGCVSLPTLKGPVLDLPVPTAMEQRAEASPERWWTRFGDSRLDSLIDEALAHNSDLRVAAARIDETRANLILADGARQPTVSASLGTSRSRATELGSFPAPAPINGKFQVGLQAAYELDWWGRYRHASAAARADLLASEMGRAVVRNGVIATVAQAWFGLIALDQQRHLAEQTVANRREWLALQRLRQQVGDASDYDLSLSEAELAAAESALAQTAQAVAAQETRLAVLVGRSPRQLGETTPDRPSALPATPEVPAGLPADLLARRPDIRQAEAVLVATDARLAEAKSAIYPNLTLTANLGSESKQLADLFSGPALVWGLAANLAQTLYNAGRTEAALDAAVARREQALVAYEATVRQAFKEALDALVAVRQSRAVAEAENRQVAARRRAAELTDLRYRNGAASHIEVLDARRLLYQAEQTALAAELARRTAVIDLFRALGGDFPAQPAG